MLDKKKIIVTFLTMATLILSFFIISISSLPKPVSSTVKIKTIPYETLVANCDKATTSPSECVGDYIRTIAQAKGFPLAQASLLAYAKEDDGFLGKCHAIGHLVGKWSYKEYGLKIINEIVDVCGFSIGHGYMEEAGKNLTNEEFASTFTKFCTKAKDISDCVHGMGHGLSTAGFTFQKADLLCQNINALYPNIFGEKKNSYNVLCMEGVMMEKLVANPKEWSSINTLEASILPCTGLSTFSYYGCRDIALRNYVMSGDLYNNSRALTLKRLEETSNYCKPFKGEELFYCSGHVGYNLSEITGVVNLDKTMAELAFKTCSKLNEDSCYAPYFSSLYSLSNNNSSLLLNYCALFSSNIKGKCEEVIKLA